MKARQLINEVHNRSVWQLLAIYVGGSFTLLGNVELLTGRFGFPGWLFRTSVVLIAAGIVGLFGMKLWPTVRKPSPAAKHSIVVGLWYVLIGWVGLEFLGLLLENIESIPEWVFHVGLAAYIVLLPAVMLAAYLWRKRRPQKPIPTVRKLSPTVRKPTSAAKHSAVVGLSYIVIGWLGLEFLGVLLENIESIPEWVFHVGLAAYIVLLPAVMLAAYFWRKRRPHPADELAMGTKDDG